jgi:hypothetical protein
MRARIVRVACVLAVLLIACQLKGKRSEHELVGAGGEALRAAFNGDIAKVRAVILVSPT